MCSKSKFHYTKILLMFHYIEIPLISLCTNNSDKKFFYKFLDPFHPSDAVDSAIDATVDITDDIAYDI